MKILLTICCISIITAVIIFLVFEYYNNEDGCEYDGEFIKIGENYSVPDMCALITCYGPNEMRGKTCPDIQAMGCVYIPQNNTNPYPECCGRFECCGRNEC